MDVLLGVLGGAILGFFFATLIMASQRSERMVNSIARARHDRDRQREDIYAQTGVRILDDEVTP